jgi:hypothetical protein
VSLPSVPTPVGEVSSEVIEACNQFVVDSRAFNDVSNSLINPGTTPEKAVEELERSLSAFAKDATAFEEIGETEAAAIIKRLAEAIGDLAAAIESSGSIRAGLRSELTNMQDAIVEGAQIGHTCP